MKLKWLLPVAGILLTFGALLYWHGTRSNTARSVLRTEPVRRGNLVATVSATGTIEPEEVVDIGAQVVGMIKEFGRDPHDSSKPIDYLARVEEGTVLARIDDAVYRARLDRAAAQTEQVRAQIEQAIADLHRAEANVIEMRAKAEQAAHDFERAKKLLAMKAMSQEDYDSRLAAAAVAKAEVTVSEAAVDQAKSTQRATEKSLLLAEADQREAQQNLDYTVIRSPVKGIIIDRRVNVGQTVVSSLNAPSLFLIAKDLTRLQVWASVNEADVGRVQSGQPVRFTVDAYPDEVFRGQVNQVRLNATMTQNVVTYTVVVDTDNPSGRLLPYLTANLRFEVGRREDVLIVPNAALRWQPRPAQIDPAYREKLHKPKAQEPADDSQEAAAKPHDRGTVWVLEQGFVHPVAVQIGLSDGVQTEVLGDALREGQNVVTGEELPAEAAEETSPFTPRMFGGGRH